MPFVLCVARVTISRPLRSRAGAPHGDGGLQDGEDGERGQQGGGDGTLEEDGEGAAGQDQRLAQGPASFRASLIPV
ncbi:MAG: hypothetical protein ACE147_06265 [Candidatus Methylomirabilales bacterium]